MIEKNRRLAALIQARLAESSPLIQVIIGPRQVGKTTALRAALPEGAVYQTADMPVPLDSALIEQWWTEASESKVPILAIDEVQKINDWSNIVKWLWDNGPKIKLVLTGSSALLVEKGLTETLAGRFELIRAEHWNYQEAKEICNLTLEQFIEFGCYPGSVPLLSDVSRWGAFVRDAIVEPAIGRDLLQLHPVDSPSLLRQLFGLSVSLPAKIVSLQKLQGQLQDRGAIQTIKTYLQLLSQSFLVSGIEKYSESEIRTKSSSPKLIVHDNALLRAFVRPITKKIEAEDFGCYFENAIGARFIEAGWDVFYWRERQIEVDFVVIGPKNEHFAVEVKSSSTTASDLKGAFEFCKRYPKFEPRLVSLVDQELVEVKTMDCREILSLQRKA